MPEVEDQVVEPLEAGLSGVPGVLRLVSKAGDEEARLALCFDGETDPYRAADAVLAALRDIEPVLPDGVESPTIEIGGATHVATVLLAGRLRANSAVARPPCVSSWRLRDVATLSLGERQVGGRVRIGQELVLNPTATIPSPRQPRKRSRRCGACSRRPTCSGCVSSWSSPHSSSLPVKCASNRCRPAAAPCPAPRGARDLRADPARLRGRRASQ